MVEYGRTPRSGDADEAVPGLGPASIAGIFGDLSGAWSAPSVGSDGAWRALEAR